VRLTDRRFLAIVFLLCGAGALYLFLSPAARDRRAAERAVAKLQAERDREWRYNHLLERYLIGLRSDPSVIELEARRLGYGRPGERTYPLSRAEIRALAARSDRAGGRPFARWAREIARSSVPALVVLLFAGLALFFFTNLRIDSTGARADAASVPSGEKGGA